MSGGEASDAVDLDAIDKMKGETGILQRGGSQGMRPDELFKNMRKGRGKQDGYNNGQCESSVKYQAVNTQRYPHHSVTQIGDIGEKGVQYRGISFIDPHKGAVLPLPEQKGKG